MDNEIYRKNIFETRERFFDEVIEKVNGERHQDYGEARISFERIAALWSAYKGVGINAQDVAIMLALMKISRLKNTPSHLDSWLDLAGYTVLGATMYE